MPSGTRNRLQLALPMGPPERNPESLKRRFEHAVGKPVALTITDNSTSLFYMKAGSRGLSLRLHRMFLGAGEEVLCELAEYMRGRRARTPLFWDFVKVNSHCLKDKPPRKVRLKPSGRCHHLEKIYEKLNRHYFGGRLRCGVTWGSYKPKRAAKKRTLGSYSSLTGTIRVNPALDRPWVPRYFVEYIVYHEMLHAHLGVEEKNGRRAIHSGEFKRREKLFKHYHRALTWEKGGLV